MLEKVSLEILFKLGSYVQKIIKLKCCHQNRWKMPVFQELYEICTRHTWNFMGQEFSDVLFLLLFSSPFLKKAHLRKHLATSGDPAGAVSITRRMFTCGAGPWYFHPQRPF